MTMKILLVEDEKKLSDALCKLLEKQKYIVEQIFDGYKAVEYINSGNYDLIILDILLPGSDGITILKKIRQSGNKIPVLLLTALESTEQKVQGLEAGADDYVTKPFSTEELLARIKAVSRRKGEIIDNIISFSDISLNLDTSELVSRTSSIKLGLKEFQIMEFFINNYEQIITKERILERIWGDESDAEYNNVEVYISFLRKKLTFLKANVEIKTSRGMGYYLHGNV